MRTILMHLNACWQRRRASTFAFLACMLCACCHGGPSRAQVCDIDGSGQCDRGDLRALYDDIDALAGPGPSDVNGDGAVDNDDISSWLTAAGNFNIGGPYLLGDADLSGCVTGVDFLIYQQNAGAVGLPLAYWEHGNFDGNVGGFDVSSVDLQTWNDHYGQCSVPEPGAFLLLAVGGLLALARPSKRNA